MVADRGVGDVEGADVEDQRSSAASEDIQAHGCARVEIDLGGVSGREVLVCEDHPTDGFEVGREVGSMTASRSLELSQLISTILLGIYWRMSLDTWREHVSR